MPVEDKYDYSTPTHYIGQTSGGRPNAVFYGPHTAIANNRPGGTVITGQPGSGKTNLALTIAMLSAISGCTTVILDYKGDFLSLLQLRDQAGRMNVQRVDGEGREGSLDPMFLGKTPQQKAEFTYQLIDIFCGGMEKGEARIVNAVIRDVIKENKVPTLGIVTQQLRRSDNDDARNVGAVLRKASDNPNAKVCFAPARKKPEMIEIAGGTTIITLMGLDLPSTEAEARGTDSGRIGSGILYMISKMVYETLKDTSNRPKTLIIDEAWAFLASKQGKQIVKDCSLLGRSKKLAYILATQNYSHLDGLDIESTITTHFAMNADDIQAKRAVEILGLPEQIEGDFVDLRRGECIMRDFKRQVAKVQIDIWRGDWGEAFQTNPFAGNANERQKKLYQEYVSGQED